MTMEKIMYDKKGPKVVEALKKRYFDAYYCSTKEEALEKVIELIPKEDSVGFGGSLTMGEMGVKEKLYELGYQVIDRDLAKDNVERDEISRKALLSDSFILGANGISADGQIVNIDGTGNRVAAMIFGPKNVIVIAGMNKVVPTLDAAIERTRTLASPMNKQRFENLKTPCAVTGQCADCTSPDCICAYLTVTRICRPAGKIKVILIGENLGM